MRVKVTPSQPMRGVLLSLNRDKRYIVPSSIKPLLSFKITRSLFHESDKTVNYTAIISLRILIWNTCTTSEFFSISRHIWRSSCFKRNIIPQADIKLWLYLVNLIWTTQWRTFRFKRRWKRTCRRHQWRTTTKRFRLKSNNLSEVSDQTAIKLKKTECE